MAIIYYPKNSLIYRKDTVSASYEQIVLSTYPNSIIYFGNYSELEQITASNWAITSSWSDTSSYSVTSSYALNGGGGGDEASVAALTLRIQALEEFINSGSFYLSSNLSKHWKLTVFEEDNIGTIQLDGPYDSI
jgi:hypothetical protein